MYSTKYLLNRVWEIRRIAMKSTCKKIVSLCLALIMVLGIVPFSTLNAHAANAPVGTVSVQDVTGCGLPVMNLTMADPSQYDTLKTVKDKQNISKFELFDTNGDVTTLEASTDKNGKTVYPLTAKGRGNSSWTMPTGKKPYNLKFEKKIDLLGMGKAKSWCLISNWVDTTFLRNYMAYQLACKMGMGTPDCQIIALCINGQYEGIYLLTEKVGLNDYRTEIPEGGDREGDINGDGIVTEIIVESDSRAYSNAEPGAFTTKGGVFFVPKDPDPEDLASSELAEVEREVNLMENAVLSGIDYEKYIDVDSWVDTYIVNELAKNPDFGYGYQPCYSSSYLYFREGGKVYAGPVWDFDIAYGRNNYKILDAEQNRDTASTTGYLTADTKYYKELLEKTDFREKVMVRWQELVNTGLLAQWQEDYRAAYEILAKSGLVEKDFQIWGSYNTRVAGTYQVGRETKDFAPEFQYVDNFVNERIAWLSQDAQWGGKTIDSIYSGGSWDRYQVGGIDTGAGYEDLTKDNTALKYAWDGGYATVEQAEAMAVQLGAPQGAIPSAELKAPITLQLDLLNDHPTANIFDSAAPYKGFGGSTSGAKLTVTHSGVYVGTLSKQWWVGNGTTYGTTPGTYVYIITVGADGSVTVDDGSFRSSADNTIPTVSKDTDNHHGYLELKSDGICHITSLPEGGSTNYFLPGSTTEVPEMKLALVEGGKSDLAITWRAEGTQYPETPLSYEQTFIAVTGNIPESWAVFGDAVEFDEGTRMVTAKKPGQATITAKAGDQSVSLTFTVAEKQAEELVGVENLHGGIYAPSLERDLPKGGWATSAAGTVYRMRYTFDLTAEQIANAESFYLADSSKKEVLTGAGDYYICVNSNPWFSADDNGTANRFAAAPYTDLTTANQNLLSMLQAGTNTIDIFMVCDQDAVTERLYLYGVRPIGGGVIPEEVPVEEVTLDKTALTLKVGETDTLTAMVAPDDATNKTLTWSSSNSKVAIVSGGRITAVGAGTATITATSKNGKTATAAVTVKAVPVENITLNKTSVSLSEGETATLTATVNPTDATDKALTWSSSDILVAKVDASGKITAVGVGAAIITVEAENGVSATAKVTVTANTVAVESITLSKTSVSLKEGETATLTATVNPTNAADKTLTWSSSNTKVATVSGGKITAVGVGTATITVKAANGVSSTAKVTVTAKTVAVESITLSKTSVSLEEGETATLTATVNPANATNKTLTWSSSNSKVATVSGGKITAVGAGTATITVKAANGVTATAKITVTAAETEPTEPETKPTEPDPTEPATPSDTWEASKAYAGGSRVIYKGKIYEAKWWIQGEVPGSNQWGAWKLIGDAVVDPPVTDPTDPTEPTEPVNPGIPAWDSGKVYFGGDQVSYNGKIYEARWWVQGDTPGANSWGPWKLIG